MTRWMIADNLCCVGEVSDSGNEGASGDDNDSDSVEEFQDGLDENLIGDDADRQRLEEMTEKEREQELYNRIERREVLRTRYGVVRFHGSSEKEMSGLKKFRLQCS